MAEPLRTDEEAWAMALENEGLANRVCRNFTTNGLPRGVDFEWLKSIAWEGLYLAAKTWDPSRGKFSTIATVIIRHELIRHMRRHEAAQGGPRSNNGNNDRVAWVNSIEGDTEHLRSRLHDNRNNGGSDDISPDYLAAEDPGYEEVEDRLSETGVVERLLALAPLTERERDIVDRKIDGAAPKDIADEFGVTVQAISLSWQRALKKLQAVAA